MVEFLSVISIHFNLTLLQLSDAIATVLLQATRSHIDDPLVNHQAQGFIYAAAIVLVSVVVTAVGFISRKVEHAIVAAFVMSLGVIITFWLTLR